jgi:hypothetical protein
MQLFKVTLRLFCVWNLYLLGFFSKMHFLTQLRPLRGVISYSSYKNADILRHLFQTYSMLKLTFEVLQRYSSDTGILNIILKKPLFLLKAGSRSWSVF